MANKYICEGKRQLSYNDFLAAVERAPCRTLSGRTRPSEGEAAYEYDCRLAELIQMYVYPVWFVNETRTEFRSYDDPEARPIRVEELAVIETLIRPKLDQWHRADAGPINHASLIIQHCAGCDRRVLIDGVHRTMWLLSRGSTATPVHVTELSGSRWPIGTPDMNVVCTCTRR